ncbi:MAG: hypothetical protein AAGF49_00865 [Pseudomonadota bacterium]
MRHFKTCLFLSASAIALATTAISTADQAHAQCALSNTAGNARIDCGPDPFNDTARFDPVTDNLILLEAEDEIETDFSGDDIIRLDGSGGAAALEVQTDTGEGFAPNLDLRGGDDRVIIQDATLEGGIFGSAGEDTFIVRDGVAGSGGFGGSFSFNGGAGADTVLIEGASDVEAILTGAGNDTVTIDGGTVRAPTEGAALDGGVNTDTLNLTAGEILGQIVNFETVNITGVTDEDITATLDIVDGNTTINLNNSTLGREAFSLSGGIRRFNALNSDFFLSGPQGIDELRLINSTLNIDGFLDISGNFTAGGGLVADNAVIDMRDGATDDVFQVGGVFFRDVTMRIDVDPTAGAQSADRLLILNSPDLPDVDNPVRGNNLVQVDFTQRPVDDLNVNFEEVFGPDEREAILAAIETFDVEAIGETYNPMRDLALVAAGDNRVNIVDVQRETVAQSPNVSNAATAIQAGENVQDVNSDMIDAAAGFGPARAGTQISPTFGVFSSGTFGRQYHDGYRVSGDGANTVSPGFAGNSYSLIGTAELDASQQFDLEDIGLRFSVFGGYTQNYVQLDRTADGINFTNFTGTGFNESGLFGASMLISKIVGEGNLNYGLVSAAGLLGRTKITNADTGGRGDYGTQGVILSTKVGRNIAVSDNVRLDVRFGGAYAYYHGDRFTDNLNTSYGSSRVSYGQLSFEPGVSTAFLLGNTVISPSARLLFIQRIGNENSASVNGTSFDFEDADFTLGGQFAATFDITDRLAAGAAVEGRVSEDARSLLGKLSLTYQFGGRES